MIELGRGGRGGAAVAVPGYGVVRASKVIYNEPTVPKREHEPISDAAPAPAGAGFFFSKASAAITVNFYDIVV